MPESEEKLEIDIDQELAGLFAQAEQDIETHEEAAPKPVIKLGESSLGEQASVLQLLRPIVLGIEALTRASGENNLVLGKIERSSAGLGGELAGLMGELRGLLEQKNGVSQRMFDALHEELRGYKDGFLLEALHRPVIRDLIALYDEFFEIHRQMTEVIQGGAEAGVPALLDSIKRMEINVKHNVEFILEVLARMEVSEMPMGEGKLDKRNQRAVTLEPAGTPEEDGDIVRILKRGFIWRDRVVRPEEVVSKKWKEVSPSRSEALSRNEA